MTRNEVIEHLNGLKGRSMASPFSYEEKALISEMYKASMGKTLRVTKCNSCFHDAVIEMYVHIIKNGHEMAENRQYWLKAGALIHCPTFHNGKAFSNLNITDEIAEEYLAQFPNGIRLFAKVPEKPVEQPKAEKPAQPVAKPKKKTAKKAKK